MEIEQQSNEGVTQESSPSTPSPAANESNQSAAASNEAGANKQTNTEANTPFHEHPRWKEIIAQRDQFQTTMQEMQKKLADYENRQKASEPKVESPEEKMLKRLESVDPEFATLMKSLVQRLPKVDQLEQNFNSQNEATQRQAVQGQLQSLHEQYKVPAEMRELYRREVKAHVNDLGDNASFADIPKYYKAVHDQISKMLDGVRRTERESYVTNKRTDAAVPAAQPRTKAPTSAPNANKYSSDRETARGQIVAEVMKNIRSGNGS